MFYVCVWIICRQWLHYGAETDITLLLRSDLGTGLRTFPRIFPVFQLSFRIYCKIYNYSIFKNELFLLLTYFVFFYHLIMWGEGVKIIWYIVDISKKNSHLQFTPCNSYMHCGSQNFLKPFRNVFYYFIIIF